MMLQRLAHKCACFKLRLSGKAHGRGRERPAPCWRGGLLMAIEKGSVPGNSKLIADVLPTVNHTDQALTYSTPFDARPSFFAAPQTTNEADALCSHKNRNSLKHQHFITRRTRKGCRNHAHVRKNRVLLAMTNGADLLDEDGYFIGENGSVNVNQKLGDRQPVEQVQQASGHTWWLAKRRPPRPSSGFGT